jgi:brefeldin A-inhibited guanine nucleotide-exchange protein
MFIIKEIQQNFLAQVINYLLETAYVLAYSIIILNTDQHNPQVKKKMTKEGFMKNNRGIDGGNDLSEELLNFVFDSIAQNEIIMKSEVAKNIMDGNSKGNLTLKLTKDSVIRRSESLAKKTEDLYKNTSVIASSDTETYITAVHVDCIKPMFDSIWMSVLTGISKVLQECSDPEAINFGLNALLSSIRIACFFEIALAKEALFSTLCKFTLLSKWQEMQAKNFESIKTLLNAAFLDGDHLEKPQWKDIVTCISQLEMLQQGHELERLK